MAAYVQVFSVWYTYIYVCIFVFYCCSLFNKLSIYVNTATVIFEIKWYQIEIKLFVAHSLLTCWSRQVSRRFFKISFRIEFTLERAVR